MDVSRFKKLPILGILRDVKLEDIDPLVEAIVASGLETVEITMNTRQALDLIRHMARSAGGRLVVGAGTVLTMEDLHLALESNATFIVLPTLVDPVVAYCAKNRIPVFPGAFSPQEIYNAWRAGASMVKVFPAKFLGPEYIREIKGPFRDIELLACGGVSVSTIRSFFSNGASAVAFGASIFKQEWFAARQFTQIETEIKKLIEEYHKR